MSPAASCSLKKNQSEILSTLLAAQTLPMSTAEAANILTLLGREFEDFSRMSNDELNALFKRCVADGTARELPESYWQSTGATPAQLHEWLMQPRFERLASVLARALPVLDQHGHADSARLDRDIRNAFYSCDIALINSSLQLLHSSFPAERLDTARFDFLFDEPEEWLLALPSPFLTICAWKLLPAAMRDLRPVRPLAQKLYSIARDMHPAALCQLIDYAILCGDWQNIAAMIKFLPSGQAPRLTRVAWLRFLTGRDSEAMSNFLDALDSLRRDASNPDAWFKTIGGVFMLLAELRLNNENSLSAAAMHIQSAISEATCFRQLYQLIEKVIAVKFNSAVSPARVKWNSEGALINIFLCIAQYWLTGGLEAAQRICFERSTELAAEGGYNWLCEECRELSTRLAQPAHAQAHRWHDTNGTMPFMLDCVLNQNSWVERLTRLEHHLEDLPPKLERRLSWVVTTEGGDKGYLTARPLEQHVAANDKWSRGRKYTAYRNARFTELVADPQDALAAEVENGLTAQDKFACEMLRSAEELLKQKPDNPRQIWAQVIAALIGHPRVFLGSLDGCHLKCIAVEPTIWLTIEDGQFKYTLRPSDAEGENTVVNLENGGQLRVCQYDESRRRLRELVGTEFRVPSDAERENHDILRLFLKRYQLFSELPLDFLKAPAERADCTPYIRLQPSGKGLDIQLMMAPFESDFFQPGEGPVEKLSLDHGLLRRMVRDFAAEQEAAHNLIAACGCLFEDNTTAPWSWFVEGQACCELTLKLRDLLDKCRVQWPEDKKFVCRRTLTLGNISLHTQSYQSWFAIDGEVHLEDSTATATLGELIQSAVIEHKRFVSLSDGQMVALSESLRRQLEELSRLGEFKSGQDKRQQIRVCRFLMPFFTSRFNTTLDHQDDSEEWLRKYSEEMQAVATVPATLQAKLRPYQQDGFTWLSRLDAVGAGACLADDMGLGKTIQAITLMLAHAAEGPMLVVAPTSLCANWRNEFERFAPNLKVEVFGPGDREEVFRHMKAGHVLITSYGLLQSELNAFKKITWRIAVLDEAQAIKNSRAKRSQAALEIKADFRVVTTGTPVENNLNELWSIFNFAIPGLLNSRETFQKRFASPVEHDGDSEISLHLRELVGPFLLRRRKDQVEADLPPKEEIDYTIELEPAEREFYDNLRHKILAELDSCNESENRKHIRVLAGITKLRLAVDHPSLVSDYAQQPAGGLSGSKLDAFLQLLKGVLANGHKVLVFSQFVKFLSIVRTSLEANGIGYQYLDGSMPAPDRQKAVDTFQNGGVPVFLISLKAGGLGLNLTEADYVIHLDSWWNPAVENQASDRAHRLGQQKKVTIYHLRAANTIEDKIRALHQRKRDLADQLLLDSDTIEKTPLEELLKLLREP